MTPEEINIKIAKFCEIPFERRTVCPWCNGITPYEAGDDYGITIWAKCNNCNNTGKVEPYYIGLPNYYGDLNAMYEALSKLTELQGCQFCDHLFRLLNASDGVSEFMKVNSPSSIRAEAIVKLLNL